MKCENVHNLNYATSFISNMACKVWVARKFFFLLNSIMHINALLLSKAINYSRVSSWNITSLVSL
jgi:hypothetical protein